MNNKEEVLALFLEKMPLVLALPRANECLAFRKASLKRPILDLGCGDGLFSQLCFGKKAIDVGLDSNPEEIKLAVKNKAYQKVITASVKKIPYPSDSFQTVIANSSLEHFEGDLTIILKEIRRVLKKKGRLFLTVPRPVISDHLFFGQVFKKLRLNWLAKNYINFKQHLWKHHHLLEIKSWQTTLQKAGFKLGQHWTLIPKEAVAISDLSFLLAWPYVLAKKWGKVNWIWRPSWLVRLLSQKLSKYCMVYEDRKGTTTFIEAIKV